MSDRAVLRDGLHRRTDAHGSLVTEKSRDSAVPSGLSFIVRLLECGTERNRRPVGRGKQMKRIRVAKTHFGHLDPEAQLSLMDDRRTPSELCVIGRRLIAMYSNQDKLWLSFGGEWLVFQATETAIIEWTVTQHPALLRAVVLNPLQVLELELEGVNGVSSYSWQQPEIASLFMNRRLAALVRTDHTIYLEFDVRYSYSLSISSWEIVDTKEPVLFWEESEER